MRGCGLRLLPNLHPRNSVRLCHHLVVTPQHTGERAQRRGMTFRPTMVQGPIPWELGFDSGLHHLHFKTLG